MLAGAARLAPHRHQRTGSRATTRFAGAMLAALVGCAVPGSALAQAPDDGKHRAAVTGRLHWEATSYRPVRLDDAGRGTPRRNQGLFRRARFGVEGAAGRFSYLVVFDADSDAGESARTVDVEDAVLYYSPSDRVRLGIGRSKIPVTFEESTSSNDINFLERSLPVDMLTDQTLGPKVTNAQVWLYGRNHLVEASIHLARDTRDAPAAEAGAKTAGFTGRVAYAPVLTGETVVHLAGWLDRSGGSVDEARWGYGPELDLVPILSGRRPAGGFETLVHRGLEAAWLHGPFWAQAEAVGGRFSLADRPAYAAGGWYAQAGYVFGGVKAYDMRAGAWTAPAVSHAVSAGGTGVVELALRYSIVDFGTAVNATGARPAGDTGHAGRQSNVTAGVNWYLTARARLMFNAIRVALDGPPASGVPPASNAAPVTGSFRLYGLRLQYQW